MFLRQLLNKIVKNTIIKECIPESKNASNDKIRLGIKKFHDNYEPFDENVYLNRNEDVRKAVENGTISSAFEHFKTVGRLEIINGTRNWEQINDINYSEDDFSSDNVLVSIICRTYNHEDYIRSALEGFLMQKTKFKFEILIGDDVSTDNTVKIIEEYQRNNPGEISLFKNSVNLGPVGNLAKISQKISGKYVAICEGDDYWTDEYKLQKQVNFLERNKNFSVCCHKVVVNHLDSRKANEIMPSNISGVAGFESLINGNFIYMNSVMYRWRFPGGLNKDNFNLEAMPADWQLHLLHAEVGKIRILDDVMGVYNRHENGIWSLSNSPIELHLKYGISEIEFFKTFENTFGGIYSQMLMRKSLYVFSLLSNHYLDNEMFEELYTLCTRFPDIFKDVFSNYGFNVNDIDTSDLNGFKNSILDQCVISVVVTSYNHENYIHQALESILSQRGSFRLEIIIGDDASTDKTSEIIMSFKERHPEIIKVMDPDVNLGVRKNLQRCFNNCTGRFVAICEGDDYWNNNGKLSKQLSSLRNNSDASMSFNWLMLYYESEGKYTPHPQQERLQARVLKFDDIVRSPIIGNFSACLYKKEAIDSIDKRYYDDPIAFDWLFNVLIAKQGDICFVKELLSVYRIHDKGLWSSNNPKVMQDKIRKTQENFFNYFERIEAISHIRPKVELFASKFRISDNGLKFNIDRIGTSADEFNIAGWMFKDRSSDNFVEKNLAFIDESDGRLIIVPLSQKERKDVVNYFSSKYKLNESCGFSYTGKLGLDKFKCYDLALFCGEKNQKNIILQKIGTKIMFVKNKWTLS
ncbi:glycosyltransferase [Enterovibrio sp. FF113]|uniref:glycosyltransferase n=1 Tax=Enterovibrio sp. FF113 TaxID=3230010 RepID=UPI00352E9FEE